MTKGNSYRAKANEFEEWATRETDPAIRQQYDMLAKSYRRLAEQAERNSLTDVVYETPAGGHAPQQPSQQQPSQQQQQVQPDKDKDGES